MASPGDRAVLNSIFNPLLPTGECVYDEDIPETLRDAPDDDEGSPLAWQKARQLEIEGVKAAESGDVPKAIDIFTEAISWAPSRPSGYNNRAQAYRLNSDIEAALSDLNNAVNLSNGRGKAACQAYCQRALIYQYQDRAEEALQDFKMAAELGNNFAKAMVVQMNPYAALCNRMLGEVFDKLRKGDDVTQ